MTPAHRTGDLAELVCSNSLKSDSPDTPQGLLKAELDLFDSLILNIARRNRVPAGKALAVDRDRFSRDITAEIEGHKRIRVVRGEATSIADPPTISIVATGPLTSDPLMKELAELIGEESLYFYDAIAPTLERDSINFDKAFFGSRYSDGEGDYVNCPLNRDEYLSFCESMTEAIVVKPHPFEEERFFSGCIPIEAMATKGVDAPRFGPMRPVGLVDPESGTRPYAVVQLRREDFGETMYHMVGFQTRMTYPEQERVFRLIPALENARFLRYGSVHRNAFINSPRLLSPALSLSAGRTSVDGKPSLYLAGQITGVEGYAESTATGLLSAMSVSRSLSGRSHVDLPPVTMLGALIKYLTTTAVDDFQPMNANFGLLPPLGVRVRGKRERRKMMAERSLSKLRDWVSKERC